MIGFIQVNGAELAKKCRKIIEADDQRLVMEDKKREGYVISERAKINKRRKWLLLRPLTLSVVKIRLSDKKLYDFELRDPVAVLAYKLLAAALSQSAIYLSIESWNTIRGRVGD